MRANSDIRPEQFVRTGGKLFFNYKIIQSIKKEENGTTRTTFDYEYVEVLDTNRSTLIRAVIGAVYAIEDELALINNQDRDQLGVEAYAKYQSFRAEVKDFVTKEVFL